ncbi:MAG: hypothetical protein JJT78_02930 [Leptospira sp.]|nr:hypothetical protein [Leptospira sp.]
MGISLPFFVISEGRERKSLRFSIDEPFLICFLIVVLGLGTVLGAMPQDIINLVGLGLFAFITHHHFKSKEMILSLLFWSFFSWFVFWVVDGKYWELVALSILFSFFARSNRYIQSLSIGIHILGIIFLFVFYRDFTHFSMASLYVEFHFFKSIAIACAMMSILAVFIANYYKPVDLLMKSSILFILFLMVFLFMNPIFSIFLYFSSLQVIADVRES